MPTYRVIADYDPMSPRDITLHVGDVFNKVKEISNGWAVGTNQSTGKTGYFPSSYVEPEKEFEKRSGSLIRRYTAKQPKAPFLHPLKEDVNSAKLELAQGI